MKALKYLIVLLITTAIHAQDFELPLLDFNSISPQIQSPLYQTFEFNEYDLLVKNINVFASSKKVKEFNFLEASASKERKKSYQLYYTAIDRQMAQYANFKVELNNSKASTFFDYHDQPIYSDLNRVRNSSYTRADRLTGTPQNRNLFFAPSLSARRGLFWY